MQPDAPVSPSPDARRVHEDLIASCRERKVIEHRVATLLARVHERRHHREFGFASIVEYAEHYFDLTPRHARELVHIGMTLPDFPRIDAAFANGEIGWTKVREILRVATPETEEAWVDRAASVSSRVLEDQVARSIRGDPPPDTDDERRAPERRRVVFDMSTSDANTLRAALALLRQQSRVEHEDVDDGVLLASLAARVLNQAEDDQGVSAERYRVLIEHCPRCGRTEGADALLAEEVVAEARCDAEHVDLRPGPSHGHATRTVPPAIRRAVLARDRYKCVVPGCNNRIWIDIHHLVHREHGGEHTMANLVSTCTVHHRMVHLRQLAMGRDGDFLVFEYPDGRTARVYRPAHPAPRGSSSDGEGGQEDDLL